jgi:hypothetical protein
VLEAIVAGIVAQIVGSLVATLIQRRLQPPQTAIEYVPETRTVTVHESVIRVGPISYHRTTSQTRIEDASFRLVEPGGSLTSRVLPFVVGLAFAGAIFALVLLL